MADQTQPKMTPLPEDFWQEEDTRRQELEQIVAENGLGGYNDKLPEDAYTEDDTASDEQPVTDELGLEQVADEDDNEDLSDEEINKAVDALTKRKGSKDADTDSESD